MWKFYLFKLGVDAAQALGGGNSSYFTTSFIWNCSRGGKFPIFLPHGSPPDLNERFLSDYNFCIPKIFTDQLITI